MTGPDSPSPSALRPRSEGPLAGLIVIDLTRVVARPRNQKKPLKTRCFQGLFAVDNLVGNVVRGSWPAIAFPSMECRFYCRIRRTTSCLRR